MGSAEKSEVVEEGAEALEEVIETTEELETDDVIIEGEELEEGEVAELEEWEKTGEEGETLPDVPVATHIKAKDKWRRQKATINTELEAAKAEIESLKAGVNRTVSTELKRPDPLGFDDDDQYEDAKDKYLIQKIRLEDQQKEVDTQKKAFTESIAKGVEVHYERVDKFVSDKKINPDVYKAAEKTVVDAIDAVFPGMGEANADFYLSKLGEGSEKVSYFLGRNKAKLAEFQDLLKKDPSGISAGIFLGAENARLRGITSGKPKTNAPKPASTATGDISMQSETASEKAYKKKYDELHKKGKGSEAYTLKNKAQSAGIDTKKWAYS